MVAVRPEAASARPAAVRRRRRPGPLVAGGLGSVLITLGSAATGSPFTEHRPGSWFFQLGPAGTNGRFLGVVAVYAGLVALLGAWLGLLGEHPAPGPRRLWAALAAFGGPLVFAGPLFSQDAYSYLAQGQMLSRGLDPYRTGAAALGPGGYLAHVAPIWRHAIAPYGPGFERLVEGLVLAAGHRLLGALALWRLVSLVSVAVLAWAVPELARATGHDPSRAVLWGVLNPLVLLTLLGGMHNDAEMIALVAAGLVVAVRGRPYLGTVLCALGAEVKAPALLAVVFLAWWAGRRGGHASGWRRVGDVAAHLALAGAVLAAVGAASGLGWGFLRAAVTPGKVVSWLDPVTALGLALSHLAAAAGLGAHQSAFVAAGRAAGLVAAGVLSLGLLLRSSTRSWPVHLGGAFLALALLGPVVWPWYETWGIVLLGVGTGALKGRGPVVLAALSALGCIADFPSARVLASGSPWLVAAGWTAVALVLAAAAYLNVPRPSRSSLEP